MALTQEVGGVMKCVGRPDDKNVGPQSVGGSQAGAPIQGKWKFINSALLAGISLAPIGLLTPLRKTI